MKGYCCDAEHQETDEVIRADIYNSEQDRLKQSGAYHAYSKGVDADADCISMGKNKKTGCIYLYVCIDSANHEWLLKNGMNYHKTLNDILTKVKDRPG